jgi:hypothetical protein
VFPDKDGEMRKEGVQFGQSRGEFPLTVGLGRDGPSWELRRWGRDRLGFSPLEEEGFSTRGDRRRLVYTGRRRSHQFTILDGQRFEYDIVLNKEPESNLICLTLEGWEGFDFFRQPDELGPEILRGSYAVYKKEGAINSPKYHVGTGKLCHIHRPKVIDARGRWAWGDIRIDRGLLTMAIPEGWLGEAKYPVTVDPVVGSSVVGAYARYDYLSQENYEEYLEEKEEDPSLQLDSYIIGIGVELDSRAALNKYKTPAQLQGAYNAYVYMEWIYDTGSFSAISYDLMPVLYSDYNNKPRYLLNYDGAFGTPMAGLGKPGDFTPRWVQSTIAFSDAVAANSDVWFGHFGKNGMARFDYGAPLIQTDAIYIDPDYKGDYSSLYEMALDQDFYDVGYCHEYFSNEKANILPGARYDLKASMYLSMPATYTRTLTQGIVQCAETRRLIGSYKRSAAQTALGTAAATRAAGLWRSAVQTVKNTMAVKGPLALMRKLTQQAGAGAVFGRWLSLLRKPAQTAGAGDGTRRVAQAKRAVADTGKAGTAIGRKQSFMRNIAHWGNAAAELLKQASYAKRLQETAATHYALKKASGFDRRIVSQTGAGAVFGRWLSLLRKPAQTAGAGDGTRRVTQAKRAVADTGKAGTAIGRKQSFMRSVAHWGNAAAGLLKQAGYAKRLRETAGSAGDVGVARKLALRLAEAAAALHALQAAGGFDRRIANTAGAGSAAGGMIAFFRVLFGVGGNADGAGRFVDRLRVVHDTETAADATGHAADYLRGLFAEAGTIAETTHKAEYRRKQQDTAQSEAASLRHLFVFIRLLTGAYIRDYIIGRFLKSREEIVVKSPVCREIALESRLH